MAGLTNTTQITNSIQRHFSKELLDRVQETLIFKDFALKSPLPGKAGAKTMRMFRFGAPSTSDVQKITTEGVPLASSTYRQLALEYVDVDLDQYVQTISITDVADATSLFNLVSQANTQNAEDAALHCDTLTQFELVTSSGTVGNVNYANKNFIYANGNADYAAVYNTGTKAGTKILTATDVLDGATVLKVRKAPKINGSYVMTAPPQVARDIMAGANSNTTWLDAAKYSSVTQLFNGEVGKLYGVRVIEHTNPYRSAATAPGAAPATNYNASGVVFSATMFGRNAYGIPDLKTLGSPFAPGVFVVGGADKSDPANLIKALISWKAFWAAKVLQPSWIVHIFTQSGSNA
jgi:N4-gp56 family major capsid protein